jgi:arylsulfatase A-like enzyme
MRVVVVSARGLRPAALGVYGSPWVETPALDELAAQGVVFDWHFADRADAAGARRAWRTGRYELPSPGHGPCADTGASGDLLNVLRQQGVHTCLIVDESRPGFPSFDIGAEFTDGWDEVYRIPRTAEPSPLERALEQAQDVLGRLSGRDGWLVWLDLATLLPPWDVPEEFLGPYFEEEVAAGDEEEEESEEEPTEEPPTPVPDPVAGLVDPPDDRLYLGLWQTYAAAVSYLDAGMGQLLETLDEQGRVDVAVVFTSDCGLPLGEHGVVGAVRAWAHEERIHVPLLLRLPGTVPRRLDALTQAVDLAPTLAALFGVSLPGAQGHDLLPLARGKVAALREYACSAVQAGEAVEWCLRTADFALLVPVRPADDDAGRLPQLYVKPDDRWEVNDVAQHHLEQIESLRRTLTEFVEATRGPGPLKPPPLPAAVDDGKGAGTAAANEPGTPR